MNFKKNLPLIVGIGLPILMILFIWASISLPGLFTKDPQFNFLYSVDQKGGYYGPGETTYQVDDSHLVKDEVPVLNKVDRDPNLPPSRPPTLFVHDVKTDQSREISFDDAAKLKLDSNPKSPDGFEIVGSEYGGGFFPFFFGSGEYRNTHYLKKGSFTRELAVRSSGSYSPYSFRFLGWLLQ